MDDYSKLFEIELPKLLLPLLIGLVSWFIKDYLFTQWRKKEELLREEWYQRLTEVWSPLYYWSGVALFGSVEGGKLGWEKHGIREMENILSRYSHLIPPKYYYVLIQIIEWNTTLPHRNLSNKDITDTRLYLYKQIELLNFVLYKRTIPFDPKNYATLFGFHQSAIRTFSQVMFDLVAWLVIALYGYLLYYSFTEEHYILFAIFTSPLISVLIRDLQKRYTMYKELKV